MIVAIARRCFGPMSSLVSLVSCAASPRARNKSCGHRNPFRRDVDPVNRLQSGSILKNFYNFENERTGNGRLETEAINKEKGRADGRSVGGEYGSLGRSRGSDGVCQRR
jgi:hypothetical protein